MSAHQSVTLVTPDVQRVEEGGRVRFEPTPAAIIEIRRRQRVNVEFFFAGEECRAPRWELLAEDLEALGLTCGQAVAEHHQLRQETAASMASARQWIRRHYRGPSAHPRARRRNVVPSAREGRGRPRQANAPPSGAGDEDPGDGDDPDSVALRPPRASSPPPGRGDLRHVSEFLAPVLERLIRQLQAARLVAFWRRLAARRRHRSRDQLTMGGSR